MPIAPKRRLFAGHEVRTLRTRDRRQPGRARLQPRYLGPLSLPDRKQRPPPHRPGPASTCPRLSGRLGGRHRHRRTVAARRRRSRGRPEHRRTAPRRQPAPRGRAAAAPDPPDGPRSTTPIAAARNSCAFSTISVDAGAGDTSRLPWEEVRDWFHAEGNYIDPLDRAAETLAGEIGSGFSERLRSEHGVTIETVDTGGTRLRAYDTATRRLTLDGALPPESLDFLLAHQLVRLEMADTIADTIVNAGLRFDASRQLLSDRPRQLRRRRADDALWRLSRSAAHTTASRHRPSAPALRRQLRAGLPPPLHAPAPRRERHPAVLPARRHGRQHHQAAFRHAPAIRPLRRRVPAVGGARSRRDSRSHPGPARRDARWHCATSRWPRGWSSRRAATPARRAATPSRWAAKIERCRRFHLCRWPGRTGADADRHSAAASAPAPTATSAPSRPPARR